MISHDRAQELISARIDAPLTAAEHRELNAHLAGCDACRVFIASTDGLTRELHALPRLAPSPAVSRAVMASISAENDGWDWLRGALQTLSSPGMAAASGLALVVALAGAMFLAMNAPGSSDGDGTSADAEATMAAVAVQPMPTKAATETPEPAATKAAPRVITGDDPATKPPANTPTPEPTETHAPIVAAALATETPIIEQAAIESPPIEPGEGPVGGGDPAIAMATEPEAAPVEEAADLAQVAEPVQTGEEVGQPETAPEAALEGEAAADAAPENTDDGNGRRDGGRRDDGGEQAAPEEPAAEPVAAETVPVPDEAITALENAGQSPDSVVLPPAPILPMPPDQAFLPITPTPVTESTPSPESEAEFDGQADAPQLAEAPDAGLGVTALAPDPPISDVIVSEPDMTTVKEEKIREKEKTDKSSRDGKSHENQQSAFDDYAMGWSMAPIDLAQEAVLPQTADDAAATAPTEAGEAAVTPAPERQIDPATGLEIDPTTGLLIDPATGYLIDPATGFVYHPGTGYQVHPITGLLIDPLTGAQLDPVTLAIVIPAGFGTGTPDYNPGDPAMRGQIETVVDDNYDNATYKVIPGTDGPVQPVGEITVPTESGEAIEIQ
jgi:hypothetical protein